VSGTTSSDGGSLLELPRRGHVRGLEHIASHRSLLFEWLRLPGDLVFIVFGAVPLVIASIKGYRGVRKSALPVRVP
jgi:nitric oxide reductase subunit B